MTHEAQRMAEEVKAKGYSLLHDQQQLFATQLGSVATALHRTAQELGAQNQASIAQYASQVADGLERFAQTLHDQDVNALLGPVEDFARRQPAAFLGGAAILGFLAARFLKSSAESRHVSDTTPATSSASPTQTAMATHNAAQEEADK